MTEITKIEAATILRKHLEEARLGSAAGDGADVRGGADERGGGRPVRGGLRRAVPLTG